MEPAQLYQNPGGEPPEVCGWYVHRPEETCGGKELWLLTSSCF